MSTMETMEKPNFRSWAHPSVDTKAILGLQDGETHLETLGTMGTPREHHGHHGETSESPSMATEDTVGTPDAQPGHLDTLTCP